MKDCPHCGKSLVKARSPDDHRRFFAIVRAAADQWPEHHEFQPDGESITDKAEHLRAWLLIKAGYFNVTPIDAEYAADQPAMARLVALSIEAALKAVPGHAFVRVHGDRIGVFSARSLKWDTMDQKQFGAVREAVEAVISDAIGVEPETLLKERAA